MLSRNHLEDSPALGTAGYLSVFVGLVAAVMFSPAHLIPWIAVSCTIIAIIFFPHALKRLINFRFLIFSLLMAVPPIFVLGDLDRNFAGISYSSEGLLAGLQIWLRVIVVYIAINGLTTFVDISSMAGLFEKAGLHGLGFSVGVALNLLPSLMQSFLNVWRSLKMRGGLRRNRWRALQLLSMTVVGNALNRAEEIALAAEARAFSPEHSRSLPIVRGKYDYPVIAMATVCLIVLMTLKVIMG